MPNLIHRTARHAAAAGYDQCPRTEGFLSQLFPLELHELRKLESCSLYPTGTCLFTEEQRPVVRFLLSWSAEAHDSRHGNRHTIRLSHEQIGECTGNSRESVTRVLGVFRRQGLFEHRRSDFFVLDRAGLEKKVYGGPANESARLEPERL